MTDLIARFRTLLATRDRGSTGAEPGLVVTLVAVVIVATIAFVGTRLVRVFTEVAAKLG